MYMFDYVCFMNSFISFYECGDFKLNKFFY